MFYSQVKKILILFLTLSFPLFSQFEKFHSNLKENCKYCHVIEEKKQNNQNAIWINFDHNNNFTPYQSSTMDANVSIPLGSSKLCLSCHDGTFSLDHLNLPNLSSSQIISNNLSASHPISFKYDSYLAYKDIGLFDPSSSPSGLGGTINSDLLVDGNLECISCHDVHGERKQEKLLIMSNYKSRLCLTCHNK